MMNMLLFMKQKNIKDKTMRINETILKNIIQDVVKNVLQEADRHREGYWKERWAKQKAEGTVPDRSEYWKNRTRKQKPKKRKTNSSYREYLERLRDEEDAMDMMTDNDWGEYFGDHD